jgi:hypothetical protein
MDIIMNELHDEYETKETMWIYKENIDLFNKYNQIKNSSVIQEKNKKEEVKKEEVKKEEVKKEEVKKEEVKKEEVKKEEVKKGENKKKEIKKENTPLDLIIEYTSTTKIFKNEIKQKLIDFITLPEFSKAFGVKKSAEIISALTRDSWNQSMALFISFLLDANIIYKEKSYIFNKNKELREISVITK